MKATVIELARRALPLMDAAPRTEAEALIAHFASTPDAGGDPFADYLQRAAAAWESDLQPARTALAAALHAEGAAALSGLRELLPGLLREAGRQPALGAVLEEAMMHAFLTAFAADASETAAASTGNAAPVTFSHAPAVTASMEQWRTRAVLPVDVGSAELRGLSREIHLRSVVSARTTSADYLDEVHAVVDDMLAGKINLATGRLRLMRKLAELGYDPVTGFPGDMGAIPPAERDSLRDLSSRTRIDLLLKTNVAMARNYGRVVAGNTTAARFAFPAWELVRLGVRETPRGFRRVQGQLVPDPPDAWSARWVAAGESVDWAGAQQSPMIALKDSPIWPALGDGVGGFTDSLGNPYPPFAFNSGMDWRAVPRSEATDIVRERDDVAPMKAQLAPTSAELLTRFERLAPALRAELERSWAE